MKRVRYLNGFILFLNLIFYSASLSAEDVSIPASHLVEPSENRYFIISIGVNEYQDSFWPSLKWSVSDATQVLDRLGKDTKYKIVRYSLLDQLATINSVTTAMKQVAEQATEYDVVLMYISGHGTLTQSVTGELERVIVLNDTDRDRLYTTGLRHSILNEWLEGLKANRKMMVFATCHSGEGKSRLPEKVRDMLGTAKGALIPLRDVSHGAMVLAAAAKGEAAYENDQLEGDIYTHYFLEALDVNDRNRDGIVSALEAHDYARDRTWEFTRGKQRPTVRTEMVGDADIPLIGVKTNEGLPVLTAYDKHLSGFFVQVDGGVKGRLPTAFPLNPEGSRVALYTPENRQEIGAYRVNATSGQQVSLHHIMNYRPLNIGFAAHRFIWADPVWENISGKSSSTSYESRIGYHFDPIGFGVILSYTDDQRATLQTAIGSDVSMQSQYLYAEYRLNYRPIQIDVRYELGYEEMEIALTDRFSGQRMLYKDRSLAQGLALMLTYNVAPDLYVSSGIGFRNASWNFDPIGNLSGDRRWFSLGLDYRFSWGARTLW